MTAGFRRARSPDQREHRRAAILSAAETLLDQRPVAEISLRELSREVGLSTSNVVRYFPTREAVFLAVLVADWGEWLDAVENTMQGSADRDVAALAEAVGQTLGARPRLCGLLATCTSVLERNIPVEAAREFKQDALRFLARLGALLRRCVPDLDEPTSVECAGIIWVLIAGAWPMARPTSQVASVLADPTMAPLRVEFPSAISRAVHVVLRGYAVTAAP